MKHKRDTCLLHVTLCTENNGAEHRITSQPKNLVFSEKLLFVDMDTIGVQFLVTSGPIK